MWQDTVCLVKWSQTYYGAKLTCCTAGLQQCSSWALNDEIVRQISIQILTPTGERNSYLGQPRPTLEQNTKIRKGEVILTKNRFSLAFHKGI